MVEELNAAGCRTRVLVAKSGATRGGTLWSRGALFHLLRNHVYVGQVTHRGTACPPGHPAIVDREVFDRVQALLDSNRAVRRDRPIAPEGSPLAGLIVDAEGLGMTPAIAYGKLGRKYRYYVSHPLQRGKGRQLDRGVVRRVAAGVIEGLVVEVLQKTAILPDSAGWRERRACLRRIQVGRDEVTIRVERGHLRPTAVAEIRKALAGGRVVEAGGKEPHLDLIVPGRPVYRGGRTWIAAPDGAALSNVRTASPALVQALKRAHSISRDHGASPVTDVESNRAAYGVADSYKRALVPLAYLAPDIQAAILEGRAPAGLTLEHLQSVTLPVSWTEQRRALGFPVG